MFLAITDVQITAWVAIASAIVVGIGAVLTVAIKVGLSLAKQLRDGLADLQNGQTAVSTKTDGLADRVQAQSGRIANVEGSLSQTNAAVNSIALATPTNPPVIKLDTVALARAMQAAHQEAAKLPTLNIPKPGA